jgi:hypothetical protein
MNERYLIKLPGIERYYSDFNKAACRWGDKAHAIRFTTRERAGQCAADERLEHFEIIPEGDFI